jgi:hypothetical protein
MKQTAHFDKQKRNAVRHTVHPEGIARGCEAAGDLISF